MQALKITYSNSSHSVDWSIVAGIFSLVGWGNRNPDEIRAAFLESSFVRFAYDGEKLVGFGRTVDDGKYYAMIVDLVIHPDYQHQGIGSRILKELTDEIESYIFTTLTSAVGKEGFYLKQGWCQQKTAFIWPRTEKQQRDNTEQS